MKKNISLKNEMVIISSLVDKKYYSDERIKIKDGEVSSYSRVIVTGW